MWIAGGFSATFTYLLYYPWSGDVRRAVHFVEAHLAWATLVALVYSAVSLTTEEGLDWRPEDDMVLVVRVGVMYTVVLAVNLVARFERSAG